MDGITERCMTPNPQNKYGLVGVTLMLLGLLLLIGIVPERAHVAKASEQTVISTRMLNAVTALNASSAIGGPMANCRESAVYIVWGAGVTSGVVTVESAVDQNYTGTWAPLAVVTFAASAPKQDIVQITGVHWSLRTRVSTIVAGGGTVTTWLVCN